MGSKFPVALAAHYLRDKQDLFRAWLSNNEDWSKSLGQFDYPWFTSLVNHIQNLDKFRK